MLSSTSRAAESSGDVASITKPLVVRRFLSANRDCRRWPDAAHFAASCNARQISELRLTDFVVRNVPDGVDAVQLRVANFDNAHLVALSAPKRTIQWPNVRVAGVAAQSWRTLTGVPAGTLPKSVVNVPGQGLFTVLSVQGTSAELNRPLNTQIPLADVSIAAPVVGSPTGG